MRFYALTYPQLANQAIELGRSRADLERLRVTHDLAERVADGVYRAQGVPILAHFVRAASIMLAENQPVEGVQVALLHGAYRMSYFRDSRRRKVRAKHRTLVRRTLGDDVEGLLFAYDCLPWYDLGSVQGHLEALNAYDLQDRQAILIRTADYLDDHLDRAMAYTGRFVDDADARAYRDACQELAVRLGAPELARDIAQAWDENRDADLPDCVVMDRAHGYERPRHHLWEMTPIESGFLNLARRTHRFLRPKPSTRVKTYGEREGVDGAAPGTHAVASGTEREG